METRGRFVTVRRIAQVIFLMGVFAKQFYIFRSGSFQIGDALFMLSFLVLLLVRDRESFKPVRKDYWLYGFIACTLLINGIWILIYGVSYTADFHFHLSALNYIYILFVVLAFRQFCEDEVFLKALRWVLQAAILIQAGVCVLNLRERYGDLRFVGTFNDPNQCAFYLMSAVFLIYMISRMTGKGWPWLWFIPAFYVIVETSSTGMMLGLAVFLVMAAFLKMTDLNLKSGVAFLVIAGIVLAAGLWFAGVGFKLPKEVTGSFMYERVMGKMETFGEGSGAGLLNMDRFIEDRSMEKLIKYPEMMLYGAGEGYFERLPAGENIRQEIHSSLLGPLFYYGIIPCLMWWIWTWLQMKGSKRQLWCVYLALIAESLTLVNNRQPFFWMIFVLAGSCLAKKEKSRFPDVPDETEEPKNCLIKEKLCHACEPKV